MAERDGELLFALDIGTRKVAGLLVAREGDKAGIPAWEVLEHPERAMLDGQVHHVEKVAWAVRALKEKLEAACGRPLQAAHVAVAGRSLLTQQGEAGGDFSDQASLRPDQVRALELQAVREARLALPDVKAASASYCVGYAVTRSSLDGVALGSLEGHRGRRAEIRVLATFLPRIVLESLVAALQQAGLSLASLTLEPIAALSVAIPADLRRLNLALVDVGAGTSDIALTRGGVVTAFAMVPLAGDELTERLCDAYLVDFEQAERLKRDLGNADLLEARDLFDKPLSLPPESVYRVLEPALAEAAREVAARILEMNGGDPPQAALLVGGGSQVPGLDRMLAEALGIPASRVGQRLPNLQRAFTGLPEGLNRVWAVTPLGIALTALRGQGLPFAHFRVNGQRVDVLNLSQRFSVFDALVAAGKEVRHFFGRPGLALSYSLNGEMKTAKGGLGTPARVLLEGRVAGFDDALRDGDELTFEEGLPGGNGRLTVGQALEEAGISEIPFRFNGKARALTPSVLMNGRPAEADEELPDQARLEVRTSRSMDALLKAMGFALEGLFSRVVAIRVDGEPRVLTQRNYRLRVNGAEAGLERLLAPGDDVEFDPNGGSHISLRDVLPPEASRPLSFTVNGRPLRLPRPPAKVFMNDREVSVDEFLIDGAEIRISPDPAFQVTPMTLLAQAPLEPGGGANRALKILVNGLPAGATTVLPDGAEVVLTREEQP